MDHFWKGELGRWIWWHLSTWLILYIGAFYLYSFWRFCFVLFDLFFSKKVVASSLITVQADQRKYFGRSTFCGWTFCAPFFSCCAVTAQRDIAFILVIQYIVQAYTQDGAQWNKKEICFFLTHFQIMNNMIGIDVTCEWVDANPSHPL